MKNELPRTSKGKEGKKVKTSGKEGRRTRVTGKMKILHYEKGIYILQHTSGRGAVHNF
jgi:hypothetical protein